MHALTREAVASFPELTDRAPLALVVDALLMRAGGGTNATRNSTSVHPTHSALRNGGAPRLRARKRAKLIRVKFCRELVRLSL
jgi:hypothetical protein